MTMSDTANVEAAERLSASEIDALNATLADQLRGRAPPDPGRQDVYFKDRPNVRVSP